MKDTVGRVGIVVGLLVLLGGVAVGVWQHATGNEDLQRWFIYGPERPKPVVYETTLRFNPVASKARVNGKDMAVNWGNWCDTARAEEFTVSGTVSIFGFSDMPTGFMTPCGAPVQYVYFALPPVFVEATVSGAVLRDGIWYYQYDLDCYCCDPMGSWSFELPGDDQWHTYEWEIRLTAKVQTRHGTESIGANKTGVTHAKECVAEERWLIDEAERVYVRFDEYLEESCNFFGDTLSTQLTIDSSIALNSAYAPRPENCDLMRITADFNGAQPDFSRLHVEIEPGTKYGSYYTNPGDYVFLTGDGNTLTWSVEDWSGWSKAPRVYTFTGLSVADMDNNLLDSLELYCTGVEEFSDGAWRTKKDTLAGWRAATYVDTFGPYSWSDEPQEGDIRLLPGVAFVIDKVSARGHGLEGYS